MQCPSSLLSPVAAVLACAEHVCTMAYFMDSSVRISGATFKRFLTSKNKYIVCVQCEEILFFFQLKKSFFALVFTRVNEKLCRCFLDATLPSPFLHRAHGDHTSLSSSLLPHSLLHSLTDNKTILLPQLFAPLAACFMYREKQKPITFEFLLFIAAWSQTSWGYRS